MVAVLNVALAGVSVDFFTRLAFILFGETPAVISGLVFALYPPLVMYSADLGTETPLLCLVTAVLFTFYAAGEKRSSTCVFSLGLLVGLAALCRPNGLMLAPALVLAIWLTTRPWKSALQMIAVLTLVWRCRSTLELSQLSLVSPVFMDHDRRSMPVLDRGTPAARTLPAHRRMITPSCIYGMAFRQMSVGCWKA